MAKQKQQQNSQKKTGSAPKAQPNARKNGPAKRAKLIYDVLKKDHEEVKDLLRDLVELDAKADPSSLVEKIRSALVPHSRAEEAVFYNKLRDREPASAKVLHSFREHLEAEGFLRALQVKARFGGDWKSTARDLRNAVEHHIREEEGEVFPLARKVVPEEEAERMAESFRKAKEGAKDQSFVRNTFTMVANLVPPRFVSYLRAQQQRLAG
jgi:hemerythrin-like domain-containing protein